MFHMPPEGSGYGMYKFGKSSQAHCCSPLILQHSEHLVNDIVEPYFTYGWKIFRKHSGSFKQAIE